MTDSRGKHCPVCEGCYDPDHCYSCGDQFLDHCVPPKDECAKCTCIAFLDPPVSELCDYHDESLCEEHGDCYYRDPEV